MTAALLPGEELSVGFGAASELIGKLGCGSALKVGCWLAQIGPHYGISP
jgi:hypothetical protein